MRGAAYDRAANLYYQWKRLPWWRLIRRHHLRQEVDRAWREQ